MSNIDKIRQEIERLKGELMYGSCSAQIQVETNCKNEAYNEILSFINSLQQEQSEVDLEAEIQMQWDSFNHHLAEYGGEREEVVWLNWNSFKDVCRDLYELGFNTKKEE